MRPGHDIELSALRSIVTIFGLTPFIGMMSGGVGVGKMVMVGSVTPACKTPLYCRAL